jgi:hypothetical protein
MDQTMHTVSEGDGPVNALDGALRKALLPCYPGLAQMHLADYKVRVVNAREETAARVRVVVEWRDREGVWGTVDRVTPATYGEDWGSSDLAKESAEMSLLPKGERADTCAGYLWNPTAS